MRSGGAAGRRRFAATAVLAAALLAPVAAGAQSAPTAADVKAAYLLKFGAFVDWPSGADGTGPLVLCVVGRDSVTSVLIRQTSNARVGTRPVVLRRLQRLAPSDGCHIAYLAGSTEQPIAESLRAVAAAPVLTITDGDAKDARGMIHFALQQNRVKFHIDFGAATRTGLTLSSKLLALALSVKP